MFDISRTILSFATATLVFGGGQAFANAPVEKEWTILVFLNGHNNLDSFGYDDINEMEQVGSTDQTNVVVQWASAKDSLKTKRLLVQKDIEPKKVTSPVVEYLPTVDMGDYKNLVEFVRWGMKNYPAKRYFVDVWNHGGGWHRFLLGESLVRDISNDDISGHVITTEQLGVAMAEVKLIKGSKIDILGFDACLMGIAEVLVQVEDSVDYVVGSQEVEPAPGWPYDGFLRGVAQLTDFSPKAVSKVLVAEYLKSYSKGTQGNQQVTLSAFDLSQLPEFKKSVKNIGTVIGLLPDPVKTPFKTVLKTTQKFLFSDYVDVGDFIGGLIKAKILSERSPEIASVKLALDKLVIANGTSASYLKAQGLSIWFPSDKYDLNKYQNRYSKLEFNLDTGWLAGIQHIHQ